MPNGDTFPFFLTKDEEACGMETGGDTAMSYQDAITNFCKKECVGSFTGIASTIDPDSLDWEMEDKLDEAFTAVETAANDAIMYLNTTYTIKLDPFPAFESMNYLCFNGGSVSGDDGEGGQLGGTLEVCDLPPVACIVNENQQVKPIGQGLMIII